LYSTPEGIDIVRKDWTSITPLASYGIPEAPPVLKLPRLLTVSMIRSDVADTAQPVNLQLVSLCGRETGNSFVAALFPEVYQRDPERYQTIQPQILDPKFNHSPCKSLVCDSQNFQTEDLIEYGDAYWIVRAFLNEWCPRAGEISTGSAKWWDRDPRTIWLPMLR
jgi:hypothetical protein